MKSFVIFCLLLIVFGFVSSERGCPDPDDVLPCVCTDRPATFLLCRNIEDADSLRTVFENSARYTYDEVHIEYSTLQYLPSTLFESVPVSELYLENVTLSALFDKPPTALDELRKLSIENSVLLQGIFWELLQPLKSLKVLDIYFMDIETLGKEFSDYVPEGIEEIGLYETDTKTIQSGTFDRFTKLNKLEIDTCEIEKLTRDILPVPFNGSILYFNYNKLSQIPDDMFSQMPNLQTLGMSTNQIATLPESVFEGTGAKLEHLFLQDNPIKCDCRILWLIRRKPKVITGKCENPKRLHGRELKDLTTGDLQC